eukprot:5530093-Pyramimonas_sp.AAC.1
MVIGRQSTRYGYWPTVDSLAWRGAHTHRLWFKRFQQRRWDFTTFAILLVRFALFTYNPPLLRTLAPSAPRASGD